MIISKSGPDGNAFGILGLVARILKQQGLTKVEQDEIMEELMAGDYDALCELAEEVTDGAISFVE